MKEVRKIEGRQGDWRHAVTFDDGSVEMIPTAHVEKLHGLEYEHEVSAGKKWDKAREAFLATSKCVLTRSNRMPVRGRREGLECSGGVPLKRPDAIAVFDIEGLQIEGARVKFRLGRRYKPTCH
jgi:hypothetical protein